MSNPKAEMIALAQRCAEQAYGNIKVLYPNCVPNLLMPGIFYVLADEALRAERTAAPASGAPTDRQLKIAGLVNSYHNDGTRLTAAETLRAIADVLGDPFDASLTPQQDVETLAVALFEATVEELREMADRPEWPDADERAEGLAHSRRVAARVLARVPPAPQPRPTHTPEGKEIVGWTAPQPARPIVRAEATFHAETILDEHTQASPAPAAQAPTVTRNGVTEPEARYGLGLPAQRVPEQARSAGRVDLDRLHELETTCILESENATDEGQARAWHERAECAYYAREALAALQRARETDGAKQ